MIGLDVVTRGMNSLAEEYRKHTENSLISMVVETDTDPPVDQISSELCTDLTFSGLNIFVDLFL